MNGCIQIEGVDDGCINNEVEDSQPPPLRLPADTVQCTLAVKSVNARHSSGIFRNGFGTLHFR